MIEAEKLLKVFNQHRGNALVVPGRVGRRWIPISTRPNRDVTVGDPSMGGHASFAFGLALAQPGHKVVLFDSEGDVLMGMGILPTIAEHRPKNFYHFMLDNGCYANTGGQPVPNAGKVSFDIIARAAGYPLTFAYDELERFAVDIEAILSQPGPVFIMLKTIPEIQNLPMGRRKGWMTRTRAQVFADLWQELGIYCGKL